MTRPYSQPHTAAGYDQDGPEAVADILRRQLEGNPHDPHTRLNVAHGLRRQAQRAMATTEPGVQVITTQRQRDFCAQIADDITSLNVDDPALNDFAHGLAEEIDEGSRWTWDRPPIAAALAALAVAVGVVGAVTGALMNSWLVLAIAAVVGAAALIAVILGFRRPAWQITARSVQPSIATPGI